jgi:succinoglycan biosynthesis transport protein ExoP
MLNRVTPHSPEDSGAGSGDLITIDLPAVVAFLKRRFWLIGATALACGLLGVVYIKVTPKSYTATAQLLIDTQKLDLFRAQAIIEDPTINTAAVESQMQILRSDEIAKKVIRHPDIKLLNTEEFGGSPPGLVRRLFLRVARIWTGASPAEMADAAPVEAAEADASGAKAPAEESWLRSVVRPMLPRWLDPFAPGPQSKAEIMQRALQKFEKQLEIKRLGVSYVIQIEFTSVDPARAAAVANKVATSYIADQLKSKFDAAERASTWLEGRITELRDQAASSDRAVQTFKAENNIINAGDLLITDQQVQELSKQRILAETNVAEAKARYDRIKAVNNSNSPDAAVTDALDNALIVRLQQQYLDLLRQQSDLAARYGRGNRTVTALEREIRANRNDMSAELRRLEETYKSDYEIASTRLAQLQAGLDKLMSTSAESLQAQVQLRELESTANSYSSLYNSFLERYIQTVQQQSFPVTEAKIITPATKPLKGSSPRSSMILGGALALGGMLGCCLAVARELLDSDVRTPAQLENISGADFLGVLPIIKRKERKEPLPETGAVSGHVAATSSRMTAAVDAPFSHYAETIRSIKLAADSFSLNHPMQVLGVVSALPGEGKTTVAANLAFLTAKAAGGKTLLLDLDLRNPSMTQHLGRHRNGLVQVLARRNSFNELVRVHESTKLHFLPAGAQSRVANTSELLRSEAMHELLSKARQEYDYIVLDLPPLVPVVDVRAVAHLVDGFVLVTEFGKTSADVVRRALRSSPVVSRKLVGAVLNRVDLKLLSRFENVGSAYYTSEYYCETAV